MDVVGQIYADCYRTLTLITEVSAGWAVVSQRNQTQWKGNVVLVANQRDLTTGANRKFIQTHCVKASEQYLARRVPFPNELTGVVQVAPSPTNKWLALIRQQPSTTPNSTPQEFLEVWSGARLVHSISLKGKHGPVYTDTLIGKLAWSPDEKYIAYVAEIATPPPEEASWWAEQQGNTKKDENTTKAPSTSLSSVAPVRSAGTTSGHRFDFREDLGEGYSKAVQSGVFVFERSSEKIRRVNGIPASYVYIGQPTWLSASRELVVVAWETQHRRFGLKYCFNRCSALFRVALPSFEGPLEYTTAPTSTATLISSTVDDGAVFSPRVTLDGSALVYLSMPPNVRTHNSAVRLRVVQLPTNGAAERPEPRTVVDVVRRTDDDKGFPGLFASEMPENCWYDAKHVVLSTVWRSSTVIVAVNIESGNVSVLSPPCANSASTTSKHFLLWKVLHVMPCSREMAGSIVAVATSPVCPDVVWFGRTLEKDPNLLEWNIVTETLDTREQQLLLGNWTYSVHSVKSSVVAPASPSIRNGSNTFEAIVVRPEPASQSTVSRLVVIPHGGPHSVFAGEFNLLHAFLVKLGYTLLLVNYRGSTGWPLDVLESLPGSIGTADVSDVMDAVKMVLDDATLSANIDKTRLALFGGSHGGFLGAHLSARYGNLFKAVVLRNPVINIASMVSTTDIPDWTFTEVYGLSRNIDTADASVVSKMFETSPIANVTKVNSPTLLLLGADDKRVPVSQGLEWHFELKKRGVPTRVLMYEGTSHAIAKVEAEGDAAVNLALWLKQHL